MTRISISNPRRERLKGYYRLRLRRAGRRLGNALSLALLPPERPWFDLSPEPARWPKVFAPLPLVGDERDDPR